MFGFAPWRLQFTISTSMPSREAEGPATVPVRSPAPPLPPMPPGSSSRIRRIQPELPLGILYSLLIKLGPTTPLSTSLEHIRERMDGPTNGWLTRQATDDVSVRGYAELPCFREIESASVVPPRRCAMHLIIPTPRL